MRWIKGDLLSQESMNSPDQFMDYSQHSHTEWFAFRPFFKEIFCENMISFYHRESHDIENSSKAFVTSFGYSPSDFRLAGFVDRWIDPSIGYEFFI